MTSHSHNDSSRHPTRYNDLASALSGKLILGNSGAYCLVTTYYPATHRHGSIDMPSSNSECYPLSAFTVHEEPGQVAGPSLLFLDTETTGLGGTGTVPFLVGVGAVREQGFEIRQYIIPDYSDEATMLEAILEELSIEHTLVTYNGSAFDLPLIRDRFIINRVARDIKVSGHLDLLHSTRRLFKRRIKDCSLVNVERELFGFYREDDVPGYLIPSIYFDWLSTEDASPLVAVLKHNRLDILSLHFLAAEINRIFQTEGESLKDGNDL